MMVTINVSEFSKTPFGRFPTDGEFSAERFRKEELVPALEGDESLEVDFSTVSLGVGSSFLEEAFGGLVRSEGFDKQSLLDRIKVISRDDVYDEQVKKFIEQA